MSALLPAAGANCHSHRDILRSLIARQPRGGWRSSATCLFLVGQQTQLVHASRADVVHNGHHGAKLGAGVRLYVDPLVLLAGEAIFHFLRELVHCDLIACRNKPCHRA